jgi:ABC-type antimicrobial peptide transport system permease subunit
VRIALGATGAAIRRLMLGRIGLLCGLGLIAGGLLILWAGRLVRSLLFGVEPWDLTSILGSALVLIMVGLLAVWIPARRASRVEPAIVLRES